MSSPPTTLPTLPRPVRQLLWSLVPVGAVVLAVLPVSTHQLGALSSFMPAMLSLVGLLDIISAVLLLGLFRDSGDRRALVLSSAYVYSLTVGLGFAASFPGVFGDGNGLGGWPSAAPWLWTAWHSGFPVLLAAAVAPWPRSWRSAVPLGRRRRAAFVNVGGVTVSGTVIVVLAANGEGWLPTLIHGRDIGALTHLVGPVLLPLVITATVVAVIGATRLEGPVRWAALATAAVCGDDILSLTALSRFSLGWYVGRGLTVVASAVVLVAMLDEFGRLRRQLALEAGRLRELLSRSEELEALHATLLDLMTDGVLLRHPDGRIIAANRAAEQLLGLTLEQLEGGAPRPATWNMIHADGSPWPLEDAPGAVTQRTGLAQRDEMLGVSLAGGGHRWLRVNTAVTNEGDDTAQYVVTSLTDDTARHLAQVAAREEREATRLRIQAVLKAGGPQIVVQPIKDLQTGDVVGGEALARFTGPPMQGPDHWFSDAASVGMGLDLELSAVRRALAVLTDVPEPCYLSVNVSPGVATSAVLLELVSAPDVPAERIVLELTEHADVADYDALRTALAPLRALGLRIAVDDAGAGYSSMSHILHLRPDFVKLDMSLVRGIHSDPARRALARGLLIFTEEIGACLIAEGVETAEDLAALRGVGLTHGQGYFLGRPAPLVTGCRDDRQPLPRPRTSR